MIGKAGLISDDLLCLNPIAQAPIGQVRDDHFLVALLHKIASNLLKILMEHK